MLDGNKAPGRLCLCLAFAAWISVGPGEDLLFEGFTYDYDKKVATDTTKDKNLAGERFSCRKSCFRGSPS